MILITNDHYLRRFLSMIESNLLQSLCESTTIIIAIPTELIFLKDYQQFICLTADKGVASSIPGTSTNFKSGLGLERGPPSLVRTIG